MSEVLKVPNTVLLIKDQRHVRGVKGVKHCTQIPIKDQKAMYVGGVESGVCGFYTTLHTEYCYSCRRCQRLLYCTLYTVASHPCQEGRLLCEPSFLGV